MPVPRALLVAAVAFAAYAGTLRNGFVFDDRDAINGSPVVRGDVPPHHAFVRDWWGRTWQESVGHYRPVPVFSLALDYRLGGGQPWAFHLGNTLLHALVAALLYLLVRGAGGEAVALGASLFFAVFAAPSEAVEAIVGRADLLQALALLLGLAAHRRAGFLPAAAACVALAAAVLTKESALIAPLAWAAADYFLPARTSFRERLPRFFAYAGILAAYLVVRGLVLHQFALPRTTHPVYNPMAFSPAVDRIFGGGRVLVERYVAGILDPSRRLYDCSAPACHPSHPGDALAWVGLALFVLLAAAPFLLRRRAPVAAAALAWFDVFFLPLTNIPMRGLTAYAERLIYLPAAGLVVAAAAGTEALGRRLGRPWLARGAFAALALGNAIALQVRHADWHDEDALYASALPYAADSVLVRQNNATTAVRRGDWAAAEEHARAAVALFERDPYAHKMLALALHGQRRDAEAELHFRRALELQHSDDLVADFAAFLARGKRYAEALELVERQLGARRVPRLEELRGRLRAKVGAAGEPRP